MFFKTKKPDEFDSWRQINKYCLKQAKKQNLSLNEFVSKIPDKLFNHFTFVIINSAYSAHTNILGETEYYPKFSAETICYVFDEERKKRIKNIELEKIKDAISSYHSENGAVISVKKAYIFHEGIHSRHKGCSTPDFETQGYEVYLENNESCFLLGSVDTYKKHGGFMDYADVNTNKSSQDCVKKYLKDTLDISQITKPENEKEILKDILIDGKENKDFINFYLAEFLVKEYLSAQKQKVKEDIKNKKIKEKIQGRIKKYKRNKDAKTLQINVIVNSRR